MKSLAKLALTLLPALVLAGPRSAPIAKAQDMTPEERLKVLTTPESLKEKLQKDKTKPPLEFFRSQVAPFDILPFVKANHWSTVSLELRANHEDYSGTLQTAPVRMLGMPRDGVAALEAPQEVFYRRDARLVKEQRARLGLQMMLPRIPKELNLELIRPEAIRADEIWPAVLRTLEPKQMLILVLTKGSNDAYGRWNQFQALIPGGADRTDAIALEKQRYYRLVLPLEPDEPLLSSHPLTWTTLSHVIWDGMAPEVLHPSQQQAMLDWIHCGGQLTLVGGAASTFAGLRDSFLGAYLPADPSGENALLKEADLLPLSKTYRPPVPQQEREEPRPITDEREEASAESKLYLPPEPIRPASNRPVFLAGLKPRPGAVQIPLGETSTHVLGVEHRVGRGRILMLTINPTDPAIASWPGIDTLVRRVLLRRPEDPLLSLGGWNARELVPPTFGSLLGPDLTWFRYVSRDLGATLKRNNAAAQVRTAGEGTTTVETIAPVPGEESPPPPIYHEASAVAEWVDSSALPRLSRDVLEEASGISIPSKSFVLKVILAYVIALVPLNWLICRYVLGRREWAWVVVPTLALGFAIGVERAAAYDLGYDAACDEIDVLETYGDYPRGHLSRFASLYSTGRVQFTISYPNDPTALALPQDNGRSLRGEDVMTSSWQSQPVPSLEGLHVQPRSLSLFRAEQMVNLSGAISLVTEDTPARVVNASDLELRDAVLIDVNGPNDRKETYLGTIAPDSSVEVKPAPAPPAERTAKGEIDRAPFLREFRSYVEDRPEEKGEIRLVAWSPKVWGGQKVEPVVDRHRGFTAVVVHLRHGPPPSPDSPRYDYLARELGRISDRGSPRHPDVVDPRAIADPYGRIMGPAAAQRRARNPVPPSTTVPAPTVVTPPSPPQARR